MTFYSVLALSIFLLSLLGTRLMILRLRARPLPPDISRLRQPKRPPVLAGGGLVVVTALIIGLLGVGIGYDVVLSLLVLVAVSLLDDIIDVPASVRLLVQVIAVAVPLSAVVEPVFGGLLPRWLDTTGALVLWVGFIRLFQNLDAVDGIAATEMIGIGAGLSLLTVVAGVFPNPLFAYGLVVVAAAGGFLWWNWHPARILLGDVGSVPIGFLLGYLLLLAAQNGYGYAAVILPAYYVGEGALFLLRCARRKSDTPPVEYYCQRAIRLGHHNETVARAIFGVNWLLAALAIHATLNQAIAAVHVGLAYGAAGALLMFFAHTRTASHADR